MSAAPTAELARPRKPGQLYPQALPLHWLEDPGTPAFYRAYDRFLGTLIDAGDKTPPLDEAQTEVVREAFRQGWCAGRQYEVSAGVAREREGARS